MPFQIIRNDITKVKADAIVNTANPEPICAGGTDSAIYNAAGKDKLLKERRKIGRLEVGQAKSTSGFDLPAKFIIHTVGPVWDNGENGELLNLRKCYDNSLMLAKELGCKSIAFPLISTGVYGFPKAEALKVAVSAFSDFLLKEDMEIYLVVFDRESFVLSGKLYSGIEEFIDENYVSEHKTQEYACDEADGLFEESCDYEDSSVEFEKFKDDYSIEINEDRKNNQRNRKEKISGRIRRKAALKEALFEETAKFSQAEASFGSSPGQALKMPSLDDRVGHLADTWQESLLKTIDDKGYTDTEVYKRANVDRKLFSKIRSNPSYQPKKITAVAFALALKLNLDDTKDFIGRAGYAFSPSSIFDLIIEYFIEQEVYDTYTINLALFDHNQPLLGE